MKKQYLVNVKLKQTRYVELESKGTDARLLTEAKQLHNWQD